jgi:uncharacterized protein
MPVNMLFLSKMRGTTMVRPFKYRKIMSSVIVDYYKPRGIPLCDLEETTLELDEFEALRLADYEELYQADAAKKMNISRQTFGNILKQAHKKIADALINGKAIQIETKVDDIPDIYKCLDCGIEWESLNFESKCPECNSENVEKAVKNVKYRPGRGRGGCCGRHGKNN